MNSTERKFLMERRAVCEYAYDEVSSYEAVVEMSRIDYYLKYGKWPRNTINQGKLDEVIKEIRSDFAKNRKKY